MRAVALVVIAGCAHAPVAPIATAPNKTCASAAHRELDFWIGDWDVAIHARQSPTSDAWGNARGHQHVEAILGGCAIAEHFTGDGPGTPWAGASYSSLQPQGWRQTWVDDSGGYLALDGTPEGRAVTLYAEPREIGGPKFQMRMVYDHVTPMRCTGSGSAPRTTGRRSSR